MIYDSIYVEWLYVQSLLNEEENQSKKGRGTGLNRRLGGRLMLQRHNSGQLSSLAMLAPLVSNY